MVVGWNPEIPRKTKARHRQSGVTYNIVQIKHDEVRLRSINSGVLTFITREDLITRYQTYA